MEIICLANSYKHQGRCIAGLDISTGHWIRPVSELEGGRIPTKNKSLNVESIRLLDIIDIPIISNRCKGHEYENYCYHDQPWRVIGQAEIAHLIQYCESSLLYSNFGKSIPFIYLQNQSPLRTLQLIEVKQLVCHSKGFGKWKATILDEIYDIADFELSITDPVALDKLNRGESISQHCLVCLSLSQPWRPNPSDELMCYRLVAGIIELIPELDMILQEMNRVGMTVEQGRIYLRKNFNKVSRYQLTPTEAQRFLTHLSSLATVTLDT
jgi:hypothetical protein